VEKGSNLLEVEEKEQKGRNKSKRKDEKTK
jgi:hypothetical protein